jgi:hypothetical protein
VVTKTNRKERFQKESCQVSTRSRCKGDAPRLQQRWMKEKSMHRLRLWPSNAEVSSAVSDPKKERETVQTWRDCYTGSRHRRRFPASGHVGKSVRQLALVSTSGKLGRFASNTCVGPLPNFLPDIWDVIRLS